MENKLNDLISLIAEKHRDTKFKPEANQQEVRSENFPISGVNVYIKTTSNGVIKLSFLKEHFKTTYNKNFQDIFYERLTNSEFGVYANFDMQTKGKKYDDFYIYISGKFRKSKHNCEFWFTLFNYLMETLRELDEILKVEFIEAKKEDILNLLKEHDSEINENIETGERDSELSAKNKVSDWKVKYEQLRKKIEGFLEFSKIEPENGSTNIDDYNREIGEVSEKFLYQHLKDKFRNLDIIWLNTDKEGKYQEKWENHDFEIRDKNGNVINYIDCKGTPKSKRTFYMTKNEWEFFCSNIDNYQIYRVYNLDNENKAGIVCIDNLMNWIIEGKVAPYLEKSETIRHNRVFLTLTEKVNGK